MSHHWKKSQFVAFRRENFGGILFHRQKGITLELDREAFRFFELCNGFSSRSQIRIRLEDEFNRTFSDRELIVFAEKLRDMGMIVQCSKIAPVNESIPSTNWPKAEHLVAPETVHWAVTYECSLNCSYCYVKKDSMFDEMDFEQIKAFIQLLSEMKVFQLAIGGGEPFLRSDLPAAVDYCYQMGIVPNITTNALHFTENILREIKGKIGRLQISFDLEETLSHYRGQGIYSQVCSGITMARKTGIPFGINLLITKRNIDDIEEIIDFLVKLGAQSVTILRPKPSVHEPCWWLKETPSPKQYGGIKLKLDYLVNKYPEFTINVDCALTFLMKDISPSKLSYNGVYGCSAGERFIVVLPNGEIYPCSHFVEEKYRVGNVFEEDFRDLWERSPVLNRFRRFRENSQFSETPCAKCIIKENCGGCRLIPERLSNNFYGEDIHCIANLGGLHDGDTINSKRFLQRA